MASLLSRILAQEAPPPRPTRGFRGEHPMEAARPPLPVQRANMWEARSIRALTILKPLMAEPLAVGQEARILRHLQDDACYLCGVVLGRPKCNGPGAATRDHVFPRDAGARSAQNILLAHGRCNLRKANRWPYPCEVIFLASVYAK